MYVNVPWTDTNTTYGLATSTNDGIMPASDKAKLDSIDTIYAKKSDAVGSLEIIPTASNIQLVAKGVDDTEVDWPTIDRATSTLAGVMTPSDKIKLDGITTITDTELKTILV
jgi:hypothetical protein|nr:MAG TPA: hypothetical protein [Caudoviricetes sp.]